jgi:hypothetical protein
VTRSRKWASYAAIAGDAAFIAWLLFNAIDDGFRGTAPEIASWIGLTVLLAVNVVLLWPRVD